MNGRATAWSPAGLLARISMWLLQFPELLRVSTWFIARLFARLSFTPYLTGRSKDSLEGFARHLATHVQHQLRYERLSERFLHGWVTALFAQAVWGPGRRKRALGRGIIAPAFVIISPSSACNLRCTHCYASPGSLSRGQLSFRTVDRLVSELDHSGTNLILLSGGEPLLFREADQNVFTLAERHPHELFVVYTNGTLIDETLARRLEKLGNVIPLISLEGLRKQTDAVRGPGTFEAVERATAQLRRAGVLFGVSVTASKNNARTLGSPQFMNEVFSKQGASFLWVLELAALGRASEDWMLNSAERDALQTRLTHYERNGHLIVSFLETNWADTGCFGAQRFDGFFYLDWSGKVRRCVYQPELSLDARSALAETERDPRAAARRVLSLAQSLPPCPFQERCSHKGAAA